MGHAVIPLVETDPYRGSHRLRWSKTATSRSLPDQSRRQLLTREQTFFSLDSEETSSQVIPYRLPRIDTPREAFVKERLSPEEHVWSRYGYEEIVKIPGELGPTVRMINPPQTYAQAERQMNLALPKFKNAAITPTARPVHWTHMPKEMDEVQIYKSMIANQRHKQLEREASSRPEPTPSPISRCESPAKSVKSIHWMLGSNKHPTFDNKGRTRCQGPFSREFTVTCIAPTNWLRMKWGRSRTMVH